MIVLIQGDHSPNQMKFPDFSLTASVRSGMYEQDAEGFEPKRVAPRSSCEAVRGVGSGEVSISQNRGSGENFENLYANMCILSAFEGKIWICDGYWQYDTIMISLTFPWICLFSLTFPWFKKILRLFQVFQKSGHLVIVNRIQQKIFSSVKNTVWILSMVDVWPVFLQWSSRSLMQTNLSRYSSKGSKIQINFRYLSYRSFANSELAHYLLRAFARPRLVFLWTEHFTRQCSKQFTLFSAVHGQINVLRLIRSHRFYSKQNYTVHNFQFLSG